MTCYSKCYCKSKLIQQVACILKTKNNNDWRLVLNIAKASDFFGDTTCNSLLVAARLSKRGSFVPSFTPPCLRLSRGLKIVLVLYNSMSK